MDAVILIRAAVQMAMLAMVFQTTESFKGQLPFVLMLLAAGALDETFVLLNTITHTVFNYLTG
jgi:hypothetical protein